MATSRTRPALDDEPLSDADRAALDRALNEPGITLSADVSEAGAKGLLAALLATGGDDEVRDLLEKARNQVTLFPARKGGSGGPGPPRLLGTVKEKAAQRSLVLAKLARSAIAAGRVAEAIGIARFNQAEATFNWDEPRNRPLPTGDAPL